MRLVPNYCVNCGIEYRWMASGWGDIQAISEFNKYGTSTHCYDCNLIILHYNKLMQNDLNKVDKISHIIDMPTNEVSLDQLLEWENLTEKENKLAYNSGNSMLPIMKQCYVNLSRINENNNWEFDKRGKVEGRDKFNGRNYFYVYWPSEKDNATITVKVRQEIKTKKILEYI